MIDYYKILELPPNATEVDIKAAYRRLSKKYHPDLNNGSKYCELRFREINEAYRALLSDRQYDYAKRTYRTTETTAAPPPTKEREYRRREYKKPVNTVRNTAPFLVLIAVFAIIVYKVATAPPYDSENKGMILLQKGNKTVIVPTNDCLVQQYFRNPTDVALSHYVDSLVNTLPDTSLFRQ